MTKRSMTARRLRLLLGAGFIFATSVACGMAEVPGERSMTGACPEGETCSEVTPMGLTFVGAGYFDDERLKLGPFLVNGTFDVGIYPTGGGILESFRFEVADPSVFTASTGTGVFGPTNEDGSPVYDVDGHATLHANREGTTFLRVVDPATGTLHDRLEIRVLDVADVIMVNVNDPDRMALHRGEEELLGVRLLATDGVTELRAIDQSVTLTASGTIQPENMYWDCFSYTVPTDMDEVTFELGYAGRTSTRTWAIVDAPAGPTAP